MKPLAVEFNSLLHNKLCRISAKIGLSKIQVLRRAVTLYDYAIREIKAGSKLSITKSGKVLHDIVL